MFQHGGSEARATMSQMETTEGIATWICGIIRKMQIVSHGMTAIVDIIQDPTTAN
jgi:hypothetical protein